MSFKHKHNTIIEVSFFSMFDDSYEILVETPSYTKQNVTRAFMDCIKDFNEKTLSSA
jgi:hypothetical protein